MAIRSQHDQRKFAKYTDQHGRKWTSWIETRTGDPCAILSPSFTAPIIPPQMYLRLDKETPGRIDVDYAQWARDLIAADTDWMRRCQEFGVLTYKDAFRPDEPFNTGILNQIGARPHIPRAVTPFREQPIPGAAALPVQACQAGNLWALGLKGPNGEEPIMPSRLHDFFIAKVAEVPEFINEFAEPAPVKVAPAVPKPAPVNDLEVLPDFLRSATASKYA